MFLTRFLTVIYTQHVNQSLEHKKLYVLVIKYYHQQQQQQHYAVLCLVAQSCLTFCHPIDCSPPGSSIHGDSPGKNTGVGCHALFQGIFPSQGSNPGLPHCRRILYCLSHQELIHLLVTCLASNYWEPAVQYVCAQWYQTLCNPTVPLSMGFSRQEK